MKINLFQIPPPHLCLRYKYHTLKFEKKHVKIMRKTPSQKNFFLFQKIEIYINSEQKISPTTQKFVKILSNLKKIELISYFFYSKKWINFQKVYKYLVNEHANLTYCSRKNQDCGNGICLRASIEILKWIRWHPYETAKSFHKKYS